MQEFPKDEKTFDMDDQFMLGPALVIKPVLQLQQNRISVYLPEESVNLF